MPHSADVLTLVLNSAEGTLQMVLGRSSRNGASEILADMSLSADSRGAEVLTPELGKMLRKLGMTASDIQRIACVRGPGSFTGIRLGLSTAFGMARACGAMLAGLDYLPLLAAEGLAAAEGMDAQTDMQADRQKRIKSGDTAWAVLHARRNEVVLQGFTCKLIPITRPQACSPAEAAQLMKEHGVPLAIFGSGLLRNVREFEAFFPEAVPFFLPKDFSCLSPVSLLKAASEARYDVCPIEPAYIRACDAEQNLPDIARNMGRNPDESVRALAALTQRQA